MAISTSCFQGRILQGCPTVSWRLGFFVAVFPQRCARIVEKMSAFVDKSQKDSVVFKKFSIPLSVFHTDSRDFCVFEEKSENLQFINSWERIDGWEKPYLPCLRANSLAVFSLFSSFPFYTYYNKEDFHYEYHYRHRPRLLRHQNSPLLVPGWAYQLRRTRTLHPPRTLRVWRVLFVCGSGRQPIQRDKTINDNYYLLTLAAIAKEIRQRSLPPECSVRIAAGLPLTSFGRDKPKFKDYLLRSNQPVKTKEVCL